MSENNVIVVDGSNVAYTETSKKGEPKVSNLVAVRRALARKGYDPIIFVDANLVHRVDDPPQLEALIDDQEIRQVPAETDADYFILETAERYQAKVVSNDQFERHQTNFPGSKSGGCP